MQKPQITQRVDLTDDLSVEKIGEVIHLLQRDPDEGTGFTTKLTPGHPSYPFFETLFDQQANTLVEITGAKLQKILWLLEPCIKKTKHGSGSMYYATNWGFKGDEGLKAAIRQILEDTGEDDEISGENELLSHL